MIPAAAALCAVFICRSVVHKSILRQIDEFKAGGAKPAKLNYAANNENKMKILRLVLVGAAVALIVLGIGNDGIADVLGKAIRICTECIGLG